MKKKSQNRIVRGLTKAFDVRTWSDIDRIKSFTAYFVESFKKLFVPRRQENSISFDKALQEYHITNEGLIKKQKALLRLTYLMCFLAVCFFSYTVYLLTDKAWSAALIACIVTLFTLVLAFRYHFWFFQIKQRKLGCTFQEWIKQGLLGGKD